MVKRKDITGICGSWISWCSKSTVVTVHYEILMSMINKIFGKNNSEISSLIEGIETDLSIQIPEILKHLIKSNSKTKLTFELLDENYQLLESFSNANIDSKFENLGVITKHLNQGDITKLPFARNLVAGKDKYLAFECLNNKCLERVLLTDYNNIINRLDITPFVSLSTKSNSESIVKTAPNSISNLISEFKLPRDLTIWKDPISITTRKLSIDEDPKMLFEIYCTYYQFKVKNENIVKMEVQGSIPLKTGVVNYSSAYKIENPNLDRSIKHNLDYRLFYYKLMGLVHSINLVRDSLNNRKGFDELIENHNLYEEAKKPLRGTNFTKIK